MIRERRGWTQVIYSSYARGASLRIFSWIVSNDAKCPAYDHPKENVQHFKFDYPAYRHESQSLLIQRKARESKLEDILNNSELVAPLANHKQTTRRFKQEKGKGWKSMDQRRYPGLHIEN